ncbi:MAG: S8 family serine peptidase [Myxococcales bacterium]|nr:S8 family serine peptidase [Myxococcales bacterium]
MPTASPNLAHDALENLVFASIAGVRLTQDSPLLPDVWIELGLRGEGESVELLLTPHRQSSALALAQALDGRLARPAEARLAHTQGIVAARLDLADLVRAALPLTTWWQRYLVVPVDGAPGGELLDLLADPTLARTIRDRLLRGLENQGATGAAGPLLLPAPPGARARHLSTDLLWLATVVGALVLIRRRGGLARAADPKAVIASLSPTARVEAFLGLLSGLTPAARGAPLWSVSLNRRGTIAMLRSTATVKADAARTVFGVAGAGVRWAVLDSGIDARHLGFRRRDRDGAPVPLRAGDWRGATRIAATYDLTSLRECLAARSVDELPEALRARLDDAGRTSAADLLEHTRRFGVDWLRWRALLEVPHDPSYEAPQHKHGTHVAGILGADWRPDDDPEDALESERGALRPEAARLGVAPEIELYDVRVADSDGGYDELALIAALQLVRALNAEHEHVEIAGVNLSLSLRHDVSNYACGRTPVCEECERLVASGVVAVAAAGNLGRARYLGSDGEVDEGYRSVSITDPGNADAVITVGATHRADPYAYGVSYFSSRGPTGDGRLKPDLVAPGEKVLSTVPGNREERMDGTSMAAPHVSGAVALLLSRHPELVGRPRELKQILTESAIDLGRERYFQGAGLLDVLAALESI